MELSWSVDTFARGIKVHFQSTIILVIEGFLKLLFCVNEVFNMSSTLKYY